MTTSPSTKRLLRDLKEWKRNQDEIITITANPIENNIYEWHANISPIDGPFIDCILHLIIKFSSNYPKSPPDVIVVGGSNFKHPNVFGSSICLDMLKSHTISEPYKGWTAGYSVLSILLQLQSFLFAENVPQDTGNYKSRNFKTIDYSDKKPDWCYTSCKGCKHTYQKPWPPLNEKRRISYQINNILNVLETTKDDFTFWSGLYLDIEKKIFDFLYVSELLKLSIVCTRFKKILIPKLYKLQHLKCWYNRIKYNENNNNIILGYGIRVKFYDYNSKYSYNKFKNIKWIHTSFNLLSYSAYYSDRIRYSLWKQMEFNSFVPIYINNKHGKKGLNLLETVIIPSLWGHNIDYKFRPQMCIELITSLMNTLIVNLMNSCEEKHNLLLHYSINTLQTYFDYYHLLLGIYNKYYNTLQPFIDNKIRLFKLDPKWRNKRYISHLGKFCILLGLSTKYNWDYIKNEITQEKFTRRVRWLLKNYPNLDINYNNDNTKISCIKFTLFFNGNLTSFRKTLFQYFFLKEIIYNNKMNANNRNIKNILSQYNNNFGFALKNNLSKKLQNHCKLIITCKNFKQYFDLLDMKCPKLKELNNLINNAFMNSAKLGYHNKINSYYIFNKSYKIINTNIKFDLSNINNKYCICNNLLMNINKDIRHLTCHYFSQCYQE